MGKTISNKNQNKNILEKKTENRSQDAASEQRNHYREREIGIKN